MRKSKSLTSPRAATTKSKNSTPYALRSMHSYILPYDKPVGPTSHDIVARMRRELGEKRIGHTGTLDPFASGLLLLCVGEATRLAEYLSDMPKSYVATARFDGSTPTDDNTSD